MRVRTFQFKITSKIETRLPFETKKNQGERNRVKFSNHQPPFEGSARIEKESTDAKRDRELNLPVELFPLVGRAYRESSQYRSSGREKEGEGGGGAG